ncbi:MAG: protein kinase domain-containing protein [Gemmatimonadaceae bacterium]
MTDPLLDRIIAAIGDRFLVEEELGRGGMGVVYRALDVRLNRRVAIKVLPPELAYHPDVRERFLREAQLAAQLTHPNIVPIFSVDECDGVVFFTMGLVDGESLSSLLARRHRLEVPEAERVLREVADALAYAHARGVVHRDIKPDNILLERETGRPMVTDFGIARAMSAGSRLTATGMSMGTPAYMSPEQAMGEREVDGRSDIYSLAVVGYQMLTGAPPFTATNTPALLMKQVAEPPKPILGVRAETPASLAGAITRALAKAPEDRWTDAGQFRDAIRGTGPHAAAAAAIAYREMRSLGAAHEAPPAPQLPVAPPDAGYAGSRGLGDAAGAASREAGGHPRDWWRDDIRERRELMREEARERRELAREEARLARELWQERRRHRGNEDKPLHKLVSDFHGHLFGSGSGIVTVWVVNLMTSPHFLWAVFPTMGMGMGIVGHMMRVRARGATWKQLFFREPVPGAELPAPPPPSPEAEALRLAPGDVLAGSYGDAVRRAAADRASIVDVISRLAPVDREQIPDVLPTVNALVERVSSLASTLHRIDADASPISVEALDRRIGEIEALPRTAEGERRVLLLRRQRSTLGDLLDKRDTLLSQLESARLALANLKLDLLKLRSSGIGAALADVTSATQQARAVSRDIGAVVAAAEEVRKL